MELTGHPDAAVVVEHLAGAFSRPHVFVAPSHPSPDALGGCYSGRIRKLRHLTFAPSA